MLARARDARGPTEPIQKDHFYARKCEGYKRSHRPFSSKVGLVYAASSISLSRSSLKTNEKRWGPLHPLILVFNFSPPRSRIDHFVSFSLSLRRPSSRPLQYQTLLWSGPRATFLKTLESRIVPWPWSASSSMSCPLEIDGSVWSIRSTAMFEAHVRILALILFSVFFFKSRNDLRWINDV